MNETPNFILAQLNDAAKRMESDGSTTYFEQVAIRASSITRMIPRATRIALTPFEPNGDPICIDTSAKTVAYISRTPTNRRFTSSAHIPLNTAEAINHYFIDYLEKVARKLK